MDIALNEEEVDLLLTGLELVEREIDGVMINKSVYPALFSKEGRVYARERRRQVTALANRLGNRP